MDAVLLTWRWQNILSIGIIIVGWALVFTLLGVTTKRMGQNSNA